MGVPAIPEELWREIMTYAVDDSDSLRTDLVELDSWSACNWQKRIFGEWWLRSPYDHYLEKHKLSLQTNLAVALVNRTSRYVAQELLLCSVIVSDGSHLRQLRARLDEDSSLGSRTKRLQIAIKKCPCKQGPELLHCVHVRQIEDGLVSLLRHCPNLRIIRISDCALPSFGPLAETLLSYHTKSLHSLVMHVAHHEQSRLINLLDHFPLLESLFLTIAPPPNETIERTIPGSGTLIVVQLPNLKTLKLHGYIIDIMEQVAAWSLPSLMMLNLDFNRCSYDFPDISDILESSGLGLQLRTFELNSLPPFNVTTILDVCPNLTTFCFNIDWPLPEGIVFPGQPHLNIEYIGLHGLSSAFGVGYISALRDAQPFLTDIIRRQNDLNFVALNKTNFPALRVIRALNTQLLRDLNRNNGPAEGEGFDRWERWWSQCATQGVRLEDCTGNQLGELPCDDEGEGFEYEDEGGSWEEDWISEQDVELEHALAVSATIQ